MKSRIFISILAAIMSMAAAAAQVVDKHGHVVDTTDIYAERSDSLDAAVFTSSAQGNYISRFKDVRTEVISAAGLCKMACCNLAESFENSASVTVGYSDAVTGARQIRLLGLSGVYTQMLDETRPVMRGLSAPFGLSYVPGQWLESIQIAKGSSSVINGVECMTGQINMEHRKPTDEKPLFLNAAVMSDTKMDLNVASSLQMGYKWSTVLLGHVSGNIKPHDSNQDGFLDEPKMLQFNVANRWLYMADNGTQVRFGVRAIQDNRHGGQIGVENPWVSDILNRSLNGYLKVGVPLNEENTQNIALVADYSYQDMDSYFGATKYIAGQHSAFANLLYQNVINESHRFTLGLNGTFDRYNEDFTRTVFAGTTEKNGITDLANAGVFGEYTFNSGEKFSAIAGLRGDWFYNQGFKVSPRVTLKYMPVDEIVIRANGGRGLRYSTPLVDNIGVFSTSKEFLGAYNEHILEDAWTFGGNFTYYIPVGATSNTYVSFDYFRTQFAQQMVVDYGQTQIDFYALDGRTSFTDNYQLDFSIDPVERFNITATFRYTNAKQEFKGSKAPVEKPMTSRFKGVLNLQYATNLNKWIFDFTASLNGSCKVYDFMNMINEDGSMTVSPMEGVARMYKNGRTPVYPMLYAQVTRRFKGWDVYVGAENLTNYTQKNPIIGASNPAQPKFDASCIWGPLMGIKAHVGFRFTLWKKA
ncbi:MAG: TonB-dependent receptor [Bacteroidales bacterium]|nr:TonB-dependent receptor [Bacteroidales bacterium]MBR5862700.1 TonB-dependent receptor [Bacteroidales bacterium]